MEAAAASVMDFHALSRRELQALCKRNGVRANMTNAAMADALQGLTSVDGIDEIGTTLCPPTPGLSTMKSAAKAAAVAGEEQQHGSPLPRGRRVSVMSPAAIRMDVEEGEDELKPVKEIVKTPGVALRSTSRRARATPAALPTPETLRRSTRAAARKTAAPVEAENLGEEVSTVKTTTRRASARSKMMVDLDQEMEVAAATPKVQQEEPKAVTSDVKCDDPKEEEEVTKLLGVDNKEEELEEGEEADSSGAVNGSALPSDKSCDDLKVEEMVAVVEQEATKPQEGSVAEQEPISVEKSGALAPMEDSPILGVLSKAEAKESVIENERYDTSEDGEGVAEWSPVNEMTDEINPFVEDKKLAAGEDTIKKDGFPVTSEIAHFPKMMTGAAVEDETSEVDDLNEGKEGAADEMQQVKLIEDDISESELDEDEECTSDDDEATDEIDSSVEHDEIDEERDCTEVSTDLNQEKELVQMLEASEDESVEEASEDDSDEEASEDCSDEEASEDGSDGIASEDGSAEDDDFSGDLPPEFDNIVVLSDAETESDTTIPELDVNQAPLASAIKSAVKSLDDSTIIEVPQVSSEELSEEAVGNKEAMKEVDGTVDTIVKSLDGFTIKEGTKQAEELQKQLKFEDLHSKSLRQLKALCKDALNAKKGKKQIAAEGAGEEAAARERGQ